MLSGGAAEREDSSEREEGQSSLIQPSGTEPSLIQPSGTEPSLIQPSGTQSPLSQPSGEQALAPLPLSQPLEATGLVKAPSPMPSFTSQRPGTARITSPDKEATLKTPTTTTQVEERTCPMRQARMKDIVAYPERVLPW